MKTLAVLMVVALILGPLVVAGWAPPIVVALAFVVVAGIVLAVANVVELVRERDVLAADNRSMRQRLTVARALLEPVPDWWADKGRLPEGWCSLAQNWLRDEDADPHVVAMRERVAKLKAQREIESIRS